MSDVSTRLSLPYIQAAQAQKHVTHNEGLRILDALVQLAVISDSTIAPPATPEAGARYLIATGATGAWAGQAPGILAAWDDTAWAFYTPAAGWIAWVADRGELLRYDGTDWGALNGLPDLQNLDGVGIGTTANATNKLSVASDATLLTHAGSDHQVKVNKSAETDTASLLFQTNWSGRAEMGITGSDDFAIKVSADGSTFHEGLIVDGATGRVSFPNGADGLAPTEFGPAPVATTDYVKARGGGNLVANGTGFLGNDYNYPAVMGFDAVNTPNLPGSMVYTGYYPGPQFVPEWLPVDPNRVYDLGCYVKQDALTGDFSANPHGDRHQQYIGIACYDIDGNQISPVHHMRYKQGGQDSLTTLAAPLAPGDTTLQLADASGWNTSSSQHFNRGIVVFGYRSAAGFLYDLYSRLAAFDLFDLGDVDTTTGIVTLNKPWPATLSNPDDPGGIWPAGTSLANSSSGGTFKYTLSGGVPLPASGAWYRLSNQIGGIDASGSNYTNGFAPGTAFVKILFLPNHSNRSGGHGSYPDTGPQHRVWYAGLSVSAAPLATVEQVPHGAPILRIPRIDTATGTLVVGGTQAQTALL